MEKYSAGQLVKLLEKQRIATVPEMLEVLGTGVERTLFRKLSTLSYLTSYSHRGQYYTLPSIARFDELGLWSHESVWFSSRGTLLATAETFVEESSAGHYAEELEYLLHVGTQDALRKLVGEGRLTRERIAGRFLYCSHDPRHREQQIHTRHLLDGDPSLGREIPEARAMPDEMKAAIILFYSLLDEKQQRLYAGLESLKIGHGGDRRIAELLRLDVGTVARGRQQLLARDVEIDRVRKKGAGRKPVEKKRPRSSGTSKS